MTESAEQPTCDDYDRPSAESAPVCGVCCDPADEDCDSCTDFDSADADRGEEVDAYLRARGYDPDEVARRSKELAERLIAKHGAEPPTTKWSEHVELWDDVRKLAHIVRCCVSDMVENVKCAHLDTSFEDEADRIADGKPPSPAPTCKPSESEGRVCVNYQDEEHKADDGTWCGPNPCHCIADSNDAHEEGRCPGYSSDAECGVECDTCWIAASSDGKCSEWREPGSTPKPCGMSAPPSEQNQKDE